MRNCDDKEMEQTVLKLAYQIRIFLQLKNDDMSEKERESYVILIEMIQDDDNLEQSTQIELLNELKNLLQENYF